MEQVEVSSIKELFTKAETNGGFEYLYVLVRIDGIQCYDNIQRRDVGPSAPASLTPPKRLKFDSCRAHGENQ